MPLKSLLILSLFFFVPIAFTQSADEKKNAAERLHAEAIKLLRETSQDVNNMRSVENRIGFSAELASLMWFHDPAEARAMYASTIADFRQLLMQLNSRMAMGNMPGDEESEMGGVLGMYGRSPVERKFRVAMTVRKQIAMSVAEHDADLAYNFFYESRGLISNPDLRKQTEMADPQFEYELIKRVAETNAAKAAQLGSASLKNGVNSIHIELLKKIYAKDADKGVEFGSAILSRIRSDKQGVDAIYVLDRLLSFGSENFDAAQKTGGKKAIYSRNDLRDLSEILAQSLMDSGPELFGVDDFADQIEKFAPGRAAQLRAKFKTSKVEGGGLSTGANSASNSNTSRSVNPEVERSNRSREQSEKAAKQTEEYLESLAKELPKEERERITGLARKIIAETPGTEKKITGLSMLAAQVARAGDRELADEIMRDAERLVNPNPKNYVDFLMTWMLASGYASANPEKAFPILENIIYRANETIAAFVKVADFMDVNEEMIADGELQVGQFGGSMIRGITSEIRMADSTIIELAKADFARMKGLTNTFDRIETRVLSKMLVLRAVLKKDDVDRTPVAEPVTDEGEGGAKVDPDITQGSSRAAIVRRRPPMSLR